MRKCGLYVALFALLFTGSYGVFSNDVSAASIYDTAYVGTDNVYIGSNRYGMSCQQEDVTSAFWDIINNESYWVDPYAHDTFISEWEGASNQSFHISNTRNGTNSSDYYWQIKLTYWDTDEGIEIGWQDAYSTLAVDTTSTASVRTLTISTASNCNPSISLSNIGTNSYVTSVYTYEPYNYTHNWIINKYDPNYPENYEGSEINSNVPKVSNEFSPDVKTHRGSNWKIDLSDYNFLTVDEYPFLCGENEFAPNIIWKIYDKSDMTLIDEMTYPASAEVHFQAEKIPEEKTYKITAKYTDCDQYDFSNETEFEFTVTATGDLKPPDYVSLCLKEDFPYLSPAGCMEEFRLVLQQLSFGAINIGGVLPTDPAGCRSLAVIGNWINKPGQVVCPEIPLEIRNAVTPFVTFAIALLAVTFFAKKNGDM